MSNETDIYRKLQQHLDDLPIGFPSTESGVEIKILKELFTPEEAEVATKLGIKFKSLEDIYKQVNNTEISIIKLEQLLDNLVSKGAIHTKKDDNTKYYCNALFMVGLYDMQFHRAVQCMLSSRYFYLLTALSLA